MRFLDRFIFGKQWTHRLIWHCSDNAGLCPDPQRSGRRTYETAFVLSFGDRLIAHPKALSFSRPRENSVHRSQKPLAVLSHFFQMFVDDTSLVLDPTCGSGTALIAAHRLGAKQVLGLEIDPETRERAVKYFDEETARGEIK
jgi:DNA modification methylase